jgi:hypothetical protein
MEPPTGFAGVSPIFDRGDRSRRIAEFRKFVSAFPTFDRFLAFRFFLFCDFRFSYCLSFRNPKAPTGSCRGFSKSGIYRGPFNMPNHIGHHIRHVVPTCGAGNAITYIFQLFTRTALGDRTSRHIARSAYPASLAGFIVSSWVRSSLRWLFSQVDVVAS